MMEQFDPAQPMQAVFDAARLHRYLLTRIWDRDRPALVICMLNPSTADARKDDPTIKRCVHFAKAWGYGGIMVINLHSFRSPHPAELRKAEIPTRDSTTERVWREAIAYADQQSEPVLVAWGGNATQDDVEPVLKVLGSTTAICLGVTASGQPKHPLARGVHRVPNDAKPIEWEHAA